MRGAERKVGAHLSIAGGFAEALKRAREIGANCLQIFSGNPRGFNVPRVSAAVGARFRKEAQRLGIAPVYFHASYLINLASEERIGESSVAMLAGELTAAARLGVRGSIVHLGSFKRAEGEDRERRRALLVARIRSILSKTPREALFVIENMGTRKIGRELSEIARIVAEANDARVRVCLDTCHLHAAGYDISTQGKLAPFLREFDAAIGLEKLEAIHANDSRDPAGSLRDRHENIGEGEVGKDVFRLLLNQPKTKHLPFIIETPGFDGKGPDKENVRRLRALAAP